MNKQKIVELKLEVAEGTLARLNLLRERTEAPTYAEVIKNALRLYEFVIQTEVDGCALLAQRPDGTTRAMSVF